MTICPETDSANILADVSDAQLPQLEYDPLLQQMNFLINAVFLKKIVKALPYMMFLKHPLSLHFSFSAFGQFKIPFRNSC
jgi:hypothetical protein